MSRLRFSFVLVFLVNSLMAQEVTTNVFYDEVLSHSDVDVTSLEHLIKSCEKRKFDDIFVREFGIPVDTVWFEHKREYFFNRNPNFAWLGNGNYAIMNNGIHSMLTMGGTTGPMIFLYDENGRFLRAVSRSGQGPSEIMSATITIVAKNEKNFFVTDGMQMKIVVFDNDGNYVREVRHSYSWIPRSFVVSPVSDRYFYCHFEPLAKIPLLTMGSTKTGIIKKFGDVAMINQVVVHAGKLHALAFNEKGYLFVIKPEEYGFDIYRDNGDFVGHVTQKPPRFWQPPSKKDVQKVLKNDEISMGIFFSHTRAQGIWYLGNNIIVINYRINYRKGGGKIDSDYLWGMSGKKRPKEFKIRSYFEFWLVNGEYLGAVELGESNEYLEGERGVLYKWVEPDKEGADGLFPNPCLVRYDLWEALRWRR